jgi:hypothetical protein
MARALCLLILSASLAQAGVVETLDGRSFVGQIRLAADGSLVVTSSNDPPQNIVLSNLLRADFLAPTNSVSRRGAARVNSPVADEDKGALPPPWQNRDVGELETRGNAAHYRGTFAVAAGHRTQHGPEDGFHFVFQSFQGDGEIIARVASIEPRDQKNRQPHAGLLMRADLAPESMNVLMSLSGGLGTYFRQWGKAIDRPAQDRRPDLKPPYWVRLVRLGNRFAGYQSTDGHSWRLLAEAKSEMPDRIFAGLALVNARPGEVARATFDHVTLGATVVPGRFMPRIVLRDGTMIADPFTAMDETAVTLSKGHGGRTVLTANVARLLFQAAPDATALAPGRTGVLMSNGDFIEGEFRGLAESRVRISSVLFGQRTYDLRNKVAAVALRDLTPLNPAFEVRTQEGSEWRARAIAVEADSLRLEEPLVGTWRIAARELADIQRR